MDVEKEHEYWNMECEKLILVRSTKVLHNKLLKLDSDVVVPQEIRLGSGIKKFDNTEILENVEKEDNIDNNINEKLENVKTIIKKKTANKKG